MFGLSAMANLSSITNTPAKLVEYAQAPATANSSATNHVDSAFETWGTRAGGCDFAGWDRGLFEANRESVYRNARGPRSRLPLCVFEQPCERGLRPDHHEDL